MQEYLNTPFEMESNDLASAYDETAAWSLPFGQLIVENIAMKPNMKVLDIGYGTGYPMLELAGRLGKTSSVYGIDMWRSGTCRARFKARQFGIDNIGFVTGDASFGCFKNNTFDLIVSNVGINNFEDPSIVFKECFRMATNGGQVAFSTNPKGHMNELYVVFLNTLKELNLNSAIESLEEHESHRHSVPKVRQLLESAGFSITDVKRDSFSWKFLDGTSFLNHHMISRGFLGGWKSVVPESLQESFFTQLECNLNAIATLQNGFIVTVPTAYIEAQK